MPSRRRFGNARIFKEGRAWFIDWPSAHHDASQKYTTLTAAKNEIDKILEEFAEVDRARFKRELALAAQPSSGNPLDTHEMQGDESYPYASPWLRLVGGVLDSLISNMTLLIGWALWGLYLGQQGQTPGKMLVHVQVIDDETGQPATLSKMFFMRGLLGGAVALALACVTLGVVLFMPFWDKKNRTITDVISRTHVIRRR